MMSCPTITEGSVQQAHHLKVNDGVVILSKLDAFIREFGKLTPTALAHCWMPRKSLRLFLDHLDLFDLYYCTIKTGKSKLE